MIKHRLIYIAVFFLISFLVGFDWKCNDEEKDPITFYVRSTNGNFTAGTYKLNGGATVSFTGIGIGSDVYEYQLTLEDVDYLEVFISKVTVDQSVEIRIYRDGVKVKSCKLEPNQQSGTTDLYDLECDYTYDEESNSTSST